MTSRLPHSRYACMEFYYMRHKCPIGHMERLESGQTGLVHVLKDMMILIENCFLLNCTLKFIFFEFISKLNYRLYINKSVQILHYMGLL